MLENVTFGVINVVEDFHNLNHIILRANYYIYNYKLNIIHPSVKVRVEATCLIGQNIAATINKLVKLVEMEQISTLLQLI